MAQHLDARETRDPAVRLAAQMRQLPQVIAAAMTAPGYRKHLKGVDPRKVRSLEALAALPVLRKSELPALQKVKPPFGGFVPGRPGQYGRLFTSPGPIYEAESHSPDPWSMKRAMFAAGFRRGDVAINTFSYHLTPGGWIFDSGARALGCAVIPAGPGNTEAQLDLIEAYRPVAYSGVPDFLKIILDTAREKGRDVSSIRKALVSGAAFPPSLQKEIAGHGIDAYQCYATADVGVIAYESAARQGLIVSEEMIVEIVRPGTGDPVAEGEVGEVVVTKLDPHHPVIRLAVGDLTAVLAGASPCGRSNLRIKGWMGRADQTAKVKGMFVRPEQVAEVLRRHEGLAKARLVVMRQGENDAMVLKVECAGPAADLAARLGADMQAVMKLKGAVEVVAPGSLPNDGKVIDDTRPVG